MSRPGPQALRFKWSRVKLGSGSFKHPPGIPMGCGLSPIHLQVVKCDPDSSQGTEKLSGGKPWVGGQPCKERFRRRYLFLLQTLTAKTQAAGPLGVRACSVHPLPPSSQSEPPRWEGRVRRDGWGAGGQPHPDWTGFLGCLPGGADAKQRRGLCRQGTEREQRHWGGAFLPPVMGG